jgi:hypothetical protein
MQRSSTHRTILYVALAALLVAGVAIPAGCSCARRPEPTTAQTGASQAVTPAVETTPVPSQATTTPEGPPPATGAVYEVGSSGPHAAERKAILAAAHTYVGDARPFVVNQIAVQQPYALASLTTQGGNTWVVALRTGPAGWKGVWKQRLADGSKTALKGAAVVDAPDLVDHFAWSAPEKAVTRASAASAIKSKLNAGQGNPDAKVTSVDIKVFEKADNGTWWMGAFVENNLDGGIVFARKPKGANWVIVDFGTGIDGSEMQGKAPAAIAAKFSAAFPQ